MDTPWKLHECNNLPKEGIQVIFSMDNVIRKSKTWRLVIRRAATSDDLLENHILEEEGQTIWETYLEIAYCPYCGEELCDVGNAGYDDYGQFVHFDYSEWKHKKQ